MDLIVSVPGFSYLLSKGGNCQNCYFSTLLLLNPDVPCLCKRCGSRSVGFWMRQLIWIYTVCHLACEFISTIRIKKSGWLTVRGGRGILIYSAWQGSHFIRGSLMRLIWPQLAGLAEIFWHFSCFQLCDCVHGSQGSYTLESLSLRKLAYSNI